jgi:uncharacterized protein YllA (UPF0747 family)
MTKEEIEKFQNDTFLLKENIRIMQHNLDFLKEKFIEKCDHKEDGKNRIEDYYTHSVCTICEKEI